MKQLSTIQYIYILLFISLYLKSIDGFAQPSKLFRIDPAIQYKGGENEYSKFLLQNFKYPPTAKENEEQGLVVIGFILTKTGMIKDIKIKNAVSEDCDSVAIRLLKMSEGKWIPATENEQAVDKYFEYQLRFLLDGAEDISKESSKAKKLFENKRYYAAFQILNEIVKHDPYVLEMLLKKGVSKLNLHDTIGACESWKRINELKDNSADNYIKIYCNN